MRAQRCAVRSAWLLCCAFVVLCFAPHTVLAGLQLVMHDAPSSLSAENPHDTKYVVMLSPNASQQTLASARADPSIRLMADKDGRRYACSPPLPLSEALRLHQSAGLPAADDAAAAPAAAAGDATGTSAAASTDSSSAQSDPSQDESNGLVAAADAASASASAAGAAAAAVRAALDAAPPAARSPHELLAPLSLTCLYRQEGLWTYEACYGKHVRQFRCGACRCCRPLSFSPFARPALWLVIAP